MYTAAEVLGVNSDVGATAGAATIISSATFDVIYISIEFQK